jgi:hypothetical protein
VTFIPDRARALSYVLAKRRAVLRTLAHAHGLGMFPVIIDVYTSYQVLKSTLMRSSPLLSHLLFSSTKRILI